MAHKWRCLPCVRPEIVAEAVRMPADVDNKGLKRTASVILLKVNEILAFRANELQGVKSFVMYGISGIFPETFIPAYCRLAPTSVGLYVSTS